ncbi:aminopeptidase [Alkaliphilus oremlandii]|uniref:Peptidase M29 aminopeptidase II n=1 Tax=Alkaliphilus oremlandii (strain OhILAs) TaxID=350688 RepID=A8MM56_ALKOO|nr:aminopeptidase [Alkaliphilus oremlandii]ABW18223.1 peptidase M29 aminopeptidase II [Alkaliphilus oremlandii OhILAs]
MIHLERNLEKYAELAVKVGINLKEKEGLLIMGNVDTLPLARLIMKKAYEAGAKHVEFQLADDEMSIIRYRHGKDFVFESFPQWKVDSLEDMYKDNYHHLFIMAPDPELLKDVDGDLVAQSQKSASVAMAPIMHYRMTGFTKWCIVAMPSAAWAKSVYPDLETTVAIEKLWEKVFEATRVDQENPVEAWQEHDRNIKKYRDFLNEKQFEKLVFKAPGTDLEVYLAEEHFWMGGSKESLAGDPFVANIPTEEVFTTPYALKVNGTLKATKPLSLNGKLVDNFGFTFKDGKVVDFYAEKGYEVLEKLMENDEGAKYLGEVALVPDDSPISNTGILFNNTLFDENASVHFALGRAYSYAMQNGSNLTEEELKAKGANFSLIHTDFMVGGPELSIVAYEKDGTEVELFKNGNWVF